MGSDVTARGGAAHAVSRESASSAGMLGVVGPKIHHHLDYQQACCPPAAETRTHACLRGQSLNCVRNKQGGKIKNNVLICGLHKKRKCSGIFFIWSVQNPAVVNCVDVVKMRFE